MALSAIIAAQSTDAYAHSDVTEVGLEARLARIAATLKARESQLSQSSLEQPNPEVAGWVNGGRRGFVNSPHRGGGGFLNNRGWRDSGDFLKRSYRGGTFIKSR